MIFPKIVKYLAASTLCLAGLFARASLKPGLDKQEALDMIAICNSYSFLELFNSDQTIIPEGYNRVYTSGVYGMDNKFQVYENGSNGVINIRGSTDKQISWLENIYSAMIPAKGVIETEGQTFNYIFAKDKKAAVHSGFALAMAYLHTDLISRIQLLNAKGIYNIILTGHSQGGALTNMFRALLDNLTESQLSNKNFYKVYTFGAPMIGNKEFIQEYNSRFTQTETAFNFIGKEDPIPDLPISYNDSNFLKESIKSFLFDRKGFSIRKVVTDGSVLLLEDKIEKYLKRFGNRTSGRISKDLGYVKMPKYVDDFNYQKPSQLIVLEKFEYPRILKDSAILLNDSIMAANKRDKYGVFENKRLYKKEPWSYQHKTYNYYVGLLSLYFPKSYAILDKKYLQENL